jgi:hypothetical protein
MPEIMPEPVTEDSDQDDPLAEDPWKDHS